MIPDTCPHCRAGIMIVDGQPCRSETRATYGCWTTVEAGRDPRRKQSATCIVREPDSLRARVRELEERVERLVEAGGLAVQFCAPRFGDDEARLAFKARAAEAWHAAKEAKP